MLLFDLEVYYGGTCRPLKMNLIIFYGINKLE